MRSESRNGSIESSTGFEEIVFDSKSAHSGSQSSIGSIGSIGSVASNASGRRGPLSYWAKVGMNAVKKVGACWRCKILKKPVSDDQKQYERTLH